MDTLIQMKTTVLKQNAEVDVLKNSLQSNILIGREIGLWYRGINTAAIETFFKVDKLVDFALDTPVNELKLLPESKLYDYPPPVNVAIIKRINGNEDITKELLTKKIYVELFAQALIGLSTNYGSIAEVLVNISGTIGEITKILNSEKLPKDLPTLACAYLAQFHPANHCKLIHSLDTVRKHRAIFSEYFNRGSMSDVNTDLSTAIRAKLVETQSLFVDYYAVCDDTEFRVDVDDLRLRGYWSKRFQKCVRDLRPMKDPSGFSIAISQEFNHILQPVYLQSFISNYDLQIKLAKGIAEDLNKGEFIEATIDGIYMLYFDNYYLQLYNDALHAISNFLRAGKGQLESFVKHNPSKRVQHEMYYIPNIEFDEGAIKVYPSARYNEAPVFIYSDLGMLADDIRDNPLKTKEDYLNALQCLVTVGAPTGFAINCPITLPVLDAFQSAPEKTNEIVINEIENLRALIAQHAKDPRRLLPQRYRVNGRAHMEDLKQRLLSKTNKTNKANLGALKIIHGVYKALPEMLDSLVNKNDFLQVDVEKPFSLIELPYVTLRAKFNSHDPRNRWDTLPSTYTITPFYDDDKGTFITEFFDTVVKVSTCLDEYRISDSVFEKYFNTPIPEFNLTNYGLLDGNLELMESLWNFLSHATIEAVNSVAIVHTPNYCDDKDALYGF